MIAALFDSKAGFEPQPFDGRASIGRGTIAARSDLQDSPRLQESIVCELDRLATKVAMVTSAANALLRPGVDFGAEVLLEQRPSDRDKLLTLAMVLAQVDGNSAVFERLSQLSGALDEGDAGLSSLAGDIRLIGAERAGVLHRERLARQWQYFSQLTADTLEASKRPLRWNLPRLFWQNASVLNGMLRSAANGFAPCVNSFGNLIEPNLPQQRLWPRYMVLQTCTVMHEGERQPALLRDASVGGLGLDRLQQRFERGTSLFVLTPSGRQFGGHVAWSEPPRAGVMLDHALSEDDPLLKG